MTRRKSIISAFLAAVGVPVLRSQHPKPQIGVGDTASGVILSKPMPVTLSVYLADEAESAQSGGISSIEFRYKDRTVRLTAAEIMAEMDAQTNITCQEADGCTTKAKA